MGKSPAGDQNDVTTGRKLLLVKPKNLPQAAFAAISENRIANPPRGDDPETAERRLIGSPDQAGKQKSAAIDTDSTRPHGRKVRRAAQALPGREAHEPTRLERRKARLNRSGEALATFPAPGIDNLAAALRGHPCAEAELAGPLQLRRSVGWLHDCLLIPAGIERKGVNMKLPPTPVKPLLGNDQ